VALSDLRGNGSNGSDAVARAVRTLRSPATIRARCGAILAAVERGESTHFRVDRIALPALADRVAALTRERFPSLQVPVHSRWRHFETGGVDRKGELDRALAERTLAAAARSRIDLAIVSVLLDAGAGGDWSYEETGVSQPARYHRSEGLAVSSFRAFMAGRFSSDPGDRYRVDAKALRGIGAADLAEIFQVSATNPLVGLDGRAALLQRLAQALADRPETFTSLARPGYLFDALTRHRAVHHLRAERILQTLLDAFSAIWPSGSSLHGEPLGDAWRHPRAGGDGDSAGWVPFHKLSQWLTYSLVEPFEAAGVQIVGLDDLTGLPEYRNGGLLLDSGVIVPLAADFAAQPRSPADEWVIEWRALTVALLDELLPLGRDRLGVSAADFPLACMLEGGTWAAGRQIAAERRPGGAPPITIVSDGTVF
jgi:hypothetical protein